MTEAKMVFERLVEIFSNIPTLKSERLTLRGMQVCDCFDMYDYARRPEVTRFLTWSPHPDVEYTKAYLGSLKSYYKLGSFYDWAIIWEEENKMIGTCGFTSVNIPNNSAEIGYVINPDYRGRGIAAEAARTVMRFGFREMELNRIEARYMVGNDASKRVMEKLGMTFEGVYRSSVCVNGIYRDVGMCSILKSEYDALKGK